jgi:hypothetical protein
VAQAAAVRLRDASRKVRLPAIMRHCCRASNPLGAAALPTRVLYLMALAVRAGACCTAWASCWAWRSGRLTLRHLRKPARRRGLPQQTRRRRPGQLRRAAWRRRRRRGSSSRAAPGSPAQLGCRALRSRARWPRRSALARCRRRSRTSGARRRRASCGPFARCGAAMGRTAARALRSKPVR